MRDCKLRYVFVSYIFIFLYIFMGLYFLYVLYIICKVHTELNRQENWGAPPPRKSASLHALGPPQFQRLSYFFLHFLHFLFFFFFFFFIFPHFSLLFFDFVLFFPFSLFPRLRDIPRSLPTCVSGPTPRLLFEFPPHSANSVILLPWPFAFFVLPFSLHLGLDIK